MDTAGLLTKKARPNFKTLGKRLGKAMKSAADAIAALYAIGQRVVSVTSK